MDIKKLNIPTGDNMSLPSRLWPGSLIVIWGEILTPAPNLAHDLLTKPMVLPAQATATDLATYNATQAVWNKKNTQVLGLMQATASPVIWKDYNHHGVAKDLFDELEATFRKAGGALTYLQLVNMVKIQFTNLMDLLSQIQQFQENYNHITSNGHSRLSEDLATFMFCSSLLKSYEQTAQQYLDNITVIATDKITDIIA